MITSVYAPPHKMCETIIYSKADNKYIHINKNAKRYSLQPAELFDFSDTKYKWVCCNSNDKEHPKEKTVYKKYDKGYLVDKFKKYKEETCLLKKHKYYNKFNKDFHAELDNFISAIDENIKLEENSNDNIFDGERLEEIEESISIYKFKLEDCAPFYAKFL
jgi:hypothetical protein